MAKKPSSDKTVTRIKATDKPKKADAPKAERPSPKQLAATEPSTSRNPLRATAGYFIGAWYELRQVSWPTRRSTWGLTGAVLAFSAFFVILILLLDIGFKYIFDQFLK